MESRSSAAYRYCLFLLGYILLPVGDHPANRVPSPSFDMFLLRLLNAHSIVFACLRTQRGRKTDFEIGRNGCSSFLSPGPFLDDPTQFFHFRFLQL